MAFPNKTKNHIFEDNPYSPEEINSHMLADYSNDVCYPSNMYKISTTDPDTYTYTSNDIHSMLMNNYNETTSYNPNADEYINAILTTTDIPDSGPGDIPDFSPGDITCSGPGDIPDSSPGDITCSGLGDIPDSGPGDITCSGPGDIPDSGPGDITCSGPGDIPDSGPGDIPCSGPGDIPDSGPHKISSYRSKAIYEELLAASTASYVDPAASKNVLQNNTHKGTNEKKKSSKTKSTPQITMALMEEEFLKRFPILPMHGDIYVYYNYYYVLLNEEMFKVLCKYNFPSEILKQLKALSTFENAYGYTLIMERNSIEEKLLTQKYRYHIVFENCVVDAKWLSHSNHSPKVAVPGKVNAKYLIHQNCKTPVMDSFLNTMTNGDTETITLIWQMIGFFLLYNVSNVRAFFWLGPASSCGKSVLIEFLTDLLDPNQVTHVPMQDLGNRFSLASLASRPIILSGESSGTLSQANVTTVKTLTGDSIIQIEEKGVDRKDILNRTKILQASNEPIHIGKPDPTDAFWGRCKLMPCTGQVPKGAEDRQFKDKLWDERDAIVTRAALYAKDLIDNNFHFIEPRLAVQMKNEWQDASLKPIDKFFKYCIEPGSYDDFIPTSVLYEAFTNYSEDCNMSLKSFSMKLKDQPFAHNKDRRYCKETGAYSHGYSGIRLKTYE